MLLPLLAFGQLLSKVHLCYALQFQGWSLRLGDTDYHVPPQVVARLDQPLPQLCTHSYTPVPVTIIASSTLQDYGGRISPLLQVYGELDDVYHEGFATNILVYNDRISHGTRSSHTLVKFINGSSRDHIPEGPYFITQDGGVHRAFRVYPDVQEAFTVAVIESGKDGYVIPPVRSEGQALGIAVPSRLYFKKSPERPLDGIRVGVKDIFDVAGIRTGLGNRAWHGLHKECSETAPAIRLLLDAGAVLVGKMKTSQFAIGETATADWIDVHAPFNPRGDGYQDTSSSSAGPAAGIASYKWLDLSIGTDTGGSIRSPSQVQGVFGNRPTHGMVSLDAVMPIAPELDTVGLLARDPGIWEKAARVLYAAEMNQTWSSLPRNLLISGFPGQADTEIDRVYLRFLRGLQTVLGGIESLAFDIDAMWTKAFPDKPTLPDFVNKTYDIITSHRQVELVRGPFFSQYAARFDGRTPFVNPSPLERWQAAEGLQSSLEDALYTMDTFRGWIDSDILPGDSHSCTRNILAYVPRRPAAKPRNEYLRGPTPPANFSISRISPLAGVPDFVLAIGEIGYFSNVTNHVEYLPVSVDLVARQHCDDVLYMVVQRLVESGIIKKVEAGRSLVTGNAPLQ